MSKPCILGLDFFSSKLCDLYLRKIKLKIQGLEIACFNKSDTEVFCCKISLAEVIIIPPHCEYVGTERITNPLFESKIGLIEPLNKFVQKHKILILKIITRVHRTEIPVRYLNMKDESVKLYENTKIATLQNVEVVEIPEDPIQTFALNSIHSNDLPLLPIYLRNILEKLPNELTQEQRQKLESLLLEYQSSFSASSTDKGLTDLVEHKINTGHAPPIKQPPRKTPFG